MKRAKRDPTNKEYKEQNLKLREENMALRENWETHTKLLTREREILGVFFHEALETLNLAVTLNDIKLVPPVIDSINKLVTPQKKETK